MRSLIAVLLIVATPVASLAGNCRSELRPLLTSTSPDATALAAVRDLCQAAAAGGDADALYQLALFDLGLAGNWQPDEALPRIRQAAAQGVPEAQYWLAWQYESGPLLTDDAATALGWYQRAANANHRLALERLARAYRQGELGLQRDPLLAAQYEARQARCLREQQRPTEN
jgi:TPR repeat protein